MKRLNAAVIMIIVSMTLAGCTGKEPNEIAYVAALGIDSAENGNYKITIQYANPTKISGGGEDNGGEENIVENIAIEAPNIYAGIGLANQIDSKTFSLSHTKLVVFSREVAQSGLKDMTELFIRSEELRPDVYLAVAAENAGEYLEAVNPVMEINPAKYYQLIFDKNKLEGLPQGKLNNFFLGVETGDYDTLLPLAGVVNEGGEEAGAQSGGNNDESTKTNTKQGEAPLNKSAFEHKMRDYIAGQNAIALKSKTEAMGSAVFLKDKMVGILGSIETEMYKLLVSDYTSGYLTIYNEKTPSDPVTVRATRRKKPKYDIDLKNKTVTVNVFLDGDVYSIPSDYSIESDLKSFQANSEEYIERECENFMRNFMKNYDSDIFRLNEHCKRKFLTNEEYYEYRNGADYSDFEVRVNVDFNIRRTGLVVKEV